MLRKKRGIAGPKKRTQLLKKAFACHLAQRKQPMHHDVLLALKHFPILQKREVKNKKLSEKRDYSVKGNHVS